MWKVASAQRVQPSHDCSFTSPMLLSIQQHPSQNEVITHKARDMSIRSEVIEQFAKVAREHGKQLPSLSDGLPLLESGLDSLCFAIVVTRLEDALGVDPFSGNDQLFPVTFGEFVSLYESAEV
jgi:hypothetical protein